MQSYHINVCVLGDAGVGKTAYIRRLDTGEFLKSYRATEGCSVTQFPYKITDTKFPFEPRDTVINFQFHEFAGAEKEHNLGRFDACIILFDLTSRTSRNNVAFWINKAKAKNPDIPIVVCGNKCDIKNLNVGLDEGYPEQTYFHLSAMSNYNFEKPILHIIDTMYPGVRT